MIPHGWKAETLGNGIELISGRHVLAKDYNDDPSGIPYITGPADFASGKIFATKYTSNPDVLCEEGDTLVTVKGSGTGQVVFSDKTYCISRQLMAVRTKQWNNKFIFYFLAYSSPRFVQLARGLIPGISREDILFTPILVPPLPEQRKIAEILSTCDEAIAKTEQLITALQTRKKGLMQRLLTGDVRFPGFVLSEKVKETKYGKVPSDWKAFHLEDVTFESRARAASENAVDLTVFGVNNQTGLTTDSKYSADNLDRYKVVKPGMFAYNPMRLNIGSIGYCDELLGKGLVSPDYVVFGCKENKLDSKYFAYCIQEHHWKNWVRRAGAGSVRVRIYYEDISRYPLVLPSLSEQRKIAEVLQACDSEINLHTKKLEALQQQKKGLMQRLLTGQVRVKA
jgi:type I restriction enzyme S subunit